MSESAYSSSCLILAIVNIYNLNKLYLKSKCDVYYLKS